MPRTTARRLGHAGAWMLGGATVVAALVAVVLAIPVEQWRTGERFENTLSNLPPGALPPPATRIWIDADPACGAGRRVDADDCLAIVYLALQAGLEIAGVSTVFGNAPLEVTHRMALELSEVLSRQGAARISVHRGASEPSTDAPKESTNDAQRALHDALSAGPLTILALGPLTNVAAGLAARPDLQNHVERIVAVMGRRPGHVFHPSEGSGTGMLFGHGPVFRDFNVAKDPLAVASLIAMDVPLVLVPYEAARDVELDDADLDAIAALGPAGRWVAQRARPWLEFWKTDVGRAGFYPFDLVAAVFLVEPRQFACARVRAEVRRDRTVFPPFSRMPALLVEETDVAGWAQEPAALYCHCVRALPGLGASSADGEDL